MPALVVEVVGDTSKLTKELSKAEAELKGFSRRTSTIRSTGANAMLADVRRMKAESAALGQSLQEVDTAAAAAGAGMSKLAIGGIAAGALIGVQALDELGRSLKVTGAEATTTGGIFRNFGAALMSRDIVGAFKALTVEPLASAQALDKLATASLKAGNQVEIDRLKAASAALGWEDFAKQMDEVSASVSKATGELARLETEADLAAVAVRTGLSAAGSDAARFGEQMSRFGRGVGAIEEQRTRAGGRKPPPKRTGISAEQRRAFFDTRIGRALDRVQDIKTVGGQVAALRKIAGEIQNRIDATKDITRKLNLEDQLVAVNRQAQDKLDRAAADAAAAAAAAARERAQALREAAAAAKAAEAARLDWLDFALEKAEDTKTRRDDLKALRDREAFLKLMIRKEGETLDRVRELWRTRKQIRDLNKSEGGPLTKTTGLNAGRLLGGLGLSRAEERALRARLSGFNSAGVALAGGSDVNLTIAIDGRAVEHSVTKNQQRRARANPPARRGR